MVSVKRKAQRTSYFATPYNGNTTHNNTIESYMRYQFAQYLIKVLSPSLPFDDDFFELLSFALGGLKNFTQEIVDVLEGRLCEKTTERYKLAHHILPAHQISKTKCEAILEDLKDCPEKRLPRELESMVATYDGTESMCMSFARFHCEENVKEVSAPLLVTRFYSRLKNYYHCSDISVKILEFLYLLKIVNIGERYFENTLEINYQKNYHKFAQMFGISIDSLQGAISELQKACLLENNADDSYLEVSAIVSAFWNTESENAIQELLYNPISGENLPANLPLEAFNLKEKELLHIQGLLKHTGDEPVHILLYGAPGTGKTCFVNSLAKALNIEGWNIASNNGKFTQSSRLRGSSQQHITDMNRCARLIASANMAKSKENVFLLIDEAERVLDTEMNAYDRSNDKAWLNAFLEERNIKCIWVVNKIQHVDQAVRRRFTYSVSFKNLSKKQRTNSFLGIFERENVSCFASKEEVAKLAKKYHSPVALVTSAVQQAKFLEKTKEDFLFTVKQVLDAHEILSHDGIKIDKKKHDKTKKIDKNYSLDAISLSKSTGITINSLMLKVERLNEQLKSKKEFPPNAGTMLFYGAPGTGKTALAQYMAKHLKKKCQIVKASDLLGAFVGQTEANIAKTFKQAEKEKALLLIDEADSFLFPRANASRSWEITQVNEFLTALESFKGICICTSNFQDKMDMAAMRRFAFKVEFTYAEKEQVLQLYSNILAPLLKQDNLKQGENKQAKGGKIKDYTRHLGMTAQESSTLLSYTKLTPGDFASVRSQYWLENENLTHKELIQALGKEQKMKLDKGVKRMGF